MGQVKKKANFAVRWLAGLLKEALEEVVEHSEVTVGRDGMTIKFRKEM